MLEGFRTSKKRVQEGIQNQKRFFIDFGVCPEVLRRVLAAAGAQFSHFQPVAQIVDFGLHLGEILGAKSSTILTLGLHLLAWRPAGHTLWQAARTQDPQAGWLGGPRLRHHAQTKVTGRVLGPTKLTKHIPASLLT
jgi:hypothetical protein